jgi:hypothetical protein
MIYITYRAKPTKKMNQATLGSRQAKRQVIKLQCSLELEHKIRHTKEKFRFFQHKPNNLKLLYISRTWPHRAMSRV